MQQGFLVTVETGDYNPSSPDGLADEIHDLLSDDLTVISVKPWAAPTEPFTQDSV